MTSQSQPVSAPKSAAREDEGSGALKPSEVLERAAALIEPEGAWTQGEPYRNAAGDFPPDGDRAVCWCALGAIWSVRGRMSCGDPEGYLARLVGNIPRWNDQPSRTQAEVVAALRKAAELARSEGQ